MVFTIDFPFMNVRLRARKLSVVPLCHRACSQGKIYGRVFDRRGATPAAALSHTVDNQVVRNLLYSMKGFKRTEDVEYALTCEEFARLTKI